MKYGIFAKSMGKGHKTPSNILWRPPQDGSSHMHKLCGSLGFSSYCELYDWSVNNSATFWETFLMDSGVLYSGNTQPTYLPSEVKGEFFGGRWFPEVKLNFAENLVATLHPSPVIGLFEDGRKIVWSRGDFLRAIANFQRELKNLGVKENDVVAACVPHCPETIVAFLATVSMGAIWTSCSPDFGLQGILDRFGQVSPKVLMLTKVSKYGGKTFDLSEKNKGLLGQLKSVVKHYELDPYANSSDGELHSIFKRSGNTSIEFVRLPFNHPLCVLYSSGTTGSPKCIVHSAGGTLLQLRKEHRLHGNIQPGNSLLYFTTCGWMMWNWSVNVLAEGAQLYCYDGSPIFPKADTLFEWLSKEKITHFGTSARFIASLRSQNLNIAASHSLSSLKTVYSTGSPLLPEDFDYFYDRISPDLQIQLASICGGTDIVSCFMLGNPMQPVHRGEIQGPGLGMAIAAFDESGRTVIGESGELVCTKPFPSMPLYFWNDKSLEKYRKAYFSKFPGVWHHGDYVTLTSHGGIIVHGRSDTTLNPGGVRIGSAEIYRALTDFKEVLDSLVVGQTIEGDERVVLFVKLEEGTSLTEELQSKIKHSIRVYCSPRHVPAVILKVQDVPYTMSGKKVELAIKDILHGRQIKNTEALLNPASLEEYKKFITDRVL